MFDEINNYLEWNSALLQHFFPTGDENPIIFLDEHLLEVLGVESGIIIQGTWEQDFLSKTLIHGTNLNNFVRDWRRYTGRVNCTAQRWDQLVLFLSEQNYIRRPCFFAMLCAIMYIACKRGANHANMNNEARIYLGHNYRGDFGQLIESLFVKLNQFYPSFDPDRMVCGRQRYISRIKFHIVLPIAQRDDFIDFVELNKIKWEDEHYIDFANNYLIPALANANKRCLIEKVTNEETIPYFKSILRSHLNYDRVESRCGNTVQTRQLKWRYELYFDFDGNPSFYIAPLFSTSFEIIIYNGQINIDFNSELSEYLSSNVTFSCVSSYDFIVNNIPYNLSNIADNNGRWNRELYFELVGENIYHQTTDLLPGHQYLKFVSTAQRGNNTVDDNWQQVDINIDIPNYDVFECRNYQQAAPARRNSERLQDAYDLYGIGSWFSVCLTGDQKIYWKPDMVGSELVQIGNTFLGQNGKTYFQLPRNNSHSLIGTLYVANNIDNPQLSQKISVSFDWNGEQTRYRMNGWGEPTEDIIQPDNLTPPTSHFILPETFNNATEISNLLVQILYDIADANGCVSQKKIVSALDFVLGYHNIIPTKQNRNNLIYALRRLGYIFSFYSPEERGYVNQLIASYLEITNYQYFNQRIYWVKGIYRDTEINDLINRNEPNHVRYKRPYSIDDLGFNPEFICLPDLIFLTTNDTGYWRTTTFTTAEYLIHLMENMNGFANHFYINTGGDLYRGQQPNHIPGMVIDRNNKEVLCTRDPNDQSLRIHDNYADNNGVFHKIPKHLARVYCENENHLPTCVMYRDLVRNIDLGHLTFLKGMGVPEVLEMALCDLSLGMPSYEYFFIVNQDNIGLPSPNSYTQGKTYSTNATPKALDSLQLLLTNLTGINVNQDFSNANISICRKKPGNRMQQSYKMRLIKQSPHQHTLMIAHISGPREELIAFTEGRNNVFYRIPGTNEFVEVIRNNINQKLSLVINNNVTNTDIGRCYEGDLPDFNSSDAQPVTIIQ